MRPLTFPLAPTRTRPGRPSLVLALGVTFVLLTGCGSRPTDPTMPTVAEVDLARYAGTWYEIASIPNRFQARCVADTRATYRPEGDAIEVRNQCRQADGSLAEATGVAKVVPGSGQAKLRVSFFRPFYGDYWVLALSPDYRWALVGEPGRDYGWVLARSKTLPPEELGAILDRAAALGYERSRFQPTAQRAD